jgi:hypothetical protein
MSDSENDAVVWEISAPAGDKKSHDSVSLESFFMAKLGVNAGKNLYKELMRVVTDSATTAVDLGSPCGQFVNYRRL